jgi:hypothetical protein
MRGAAIVRASWAGTAALVAGGALADAFERALLPVSILDLVLFTGGMVIFFWAYATAVARSRSDEIGIGGLYFLQGTAPRPVQLRLMGSLGAQVVVAFVVAGVRPFSAAAFALLVPMWGLGLAGLWGARYGTFSPRTGPVTPGSAP